MSDRFTETTRKGWFSRLGSAFAGVLVGIVMVFVGIGLIGWNENRAVRTERALNEGSGAVVSVEADAVNPANDGALIHVSGDTSTTEPIIDPQFNIGGMGLHLTRHVEMYQWQEEERRETRTKLGGGEETTTTYSYNRVWSMHPQESGSFRIPEGHQNPAFPIEGADFSAEDARLGAFALDDAVIDQVGGAGPLLLNDEAQATARENAGRNATVNRTTIYLGANPETPAVGDVRITYQMVPDGVISVVAAQSGQGLAAYRARNGERILLVADGSQSAESMFATAQDTNRFILWAVRVGGLFALVMGFGLILNPLKVLADVVPLVGTIVGMGTGLIALVLGVAVGAITIAIAWFAVRPVLSIIILLVGGGLAFLFWRFGRGRLKKARAADPTPAAS